MTEVMSGEAATNLLIYGQAPEGMYTEGSVWLSARLLRAPVILPANSFIRSLSFSDFQEPITWGSGFHCESLSLSDCPIEALPDDIIIELGLEIRQCMRFHTLPSRLQLRELSLVDLPQLSSVLTHTTVTDRLTLTNCPQVTSLPDMREVSMLTLAGMSSLRALPYGLHAQYLDLSGCTHLEGWDDPEITTLRQLNLRDCSSFHALPPNLRQIDRLDISGCTRLNMLPPFLTVTDWLDIGGTAIHSLPPAAYNWELHWNGIPVSGQVAFHPETITAQMVLAETNAEVRRVMLERMGIERFMQEATPEVRDEDSDPGGQRRLLAIDFPREETLVALQVRDPSTGRGYLLRVPPEMHTCHQAAAWIAGFDNPDDYQPIAET